MLLLINLSDVYSPSRKNKRYGPTIYFNVDQIFHFKTGLSLIWCFTCHIYDDVSYDLGRKVHVQVCVSV